MTTFDLEKETKAAGKFIIEKFEVPNVRARIGVNADVSGSTEGLYKSGKMQAALQRVLPITLNFDDDGDMDFWTFNGGQDFNYLGALNRGNYAKFVQEQIMQNARIHKWGSTDYSPVMQANLAHYGYRHEGQPSKKGWSFGKLFGRGNTESVLDSAAQSAYPTLIYHVTDGGNSHSDREPTRRLLHECESKRIPIYFHMIGIGDSSYFEFIEQIADEFGNVGFVNVSDVTRLSDGADEVYDLLLPEEMRGWFKRNFNSR